MEDQFQRLLRMTRQADERQKTRPLVILEDLPGVLDPLVHPPTGNGREGLARARRADRPPIQRDAGRCVMPFDVAVREARARLV